MRELFIAIVNLPFGLVVGAATERLSRSIHARARLHNIILKITVAYFAVSLIFGHEPWSYPNNKLMEADTKWLIFALNRLLIFAVGSIIGSAFQPVGLTGGIATGKSTVSSLLQQKSEEKEDDIEFIIIDVDGIAHDILLPKKLGQDSVYDRLVSEFGAGILVQKNDATTPNIDRRKLGDIVFPDRQKRKKLNSITHPKIIKIMVKRILAEGLNLGRFTANDKAKNKKKLRVVCVDIPLLFEGGLPMRLLFGTIVVVACNSTLQLERLHKRNPDLTIEQCRQRIASQIPVENKARKAHFVVRNDDCLKSLKNQVGSVKGQVANMVSGSQRGVELWWLVVGFGGFVLKQQYI